MLLDIEPAPKQDKNGIFDAPFLGRGFRPFFLLGALYAVWSIGIWAPLFSGHLVLSGGVWDDMMLWHGHEMVFGFAAAIIAGFLLTAVPNWTGQPQVKGAALMVLCLVWLAGRVAMYAAPAGWGQGLVDVAFFPILGFMLARPLLRVGNKGNYVFLILLLALTLCNAAMHLVHVTPVVDGLARAGLYGAFMLIMIMISLVGGRVVPFFTVAALRHRGLNLPQTDQPKMDALALLSLVMVAAVLMAGALMRTPPAPYWAMLSGGFAAVVHVARMRHWHLRPGLAVPMVWILHMGFVWLAVGLLLLAGAGYWPDLFFPALHAMSVGCIGSMTVGMMCRVSRGHTGRDIVAGRGEVAAFVLIQLAALLRVAGPLLAPGMHVTWISLSAVLWCVCYAIYLPVFIPVLFSPRPDGRPA